MARHSGNLNKHVRGEDVTPVASTARVASGNSGWLNAEEFDSLVLTLDVTVDNFTTLDVIVEEASDSVGTNSRAASGSPFAQVAGVATARKSFQIADKYYRVAWTLVGTGGTWSVSGFTK